MDDNNDWVAAAESPLVPGTKAHAVALTPVVFFLMHFRVWTFLVCLCVAVVLVVLSAKGWSVGWLWRRLRCRLRGARICARPVWWRRQMLLGYSFGEIPMSMLRSDRRRRL